MARILSLFFFFSSIAKRAPYSEDILGTQRATDCMETAFLGAEGDVQQALDELDGRQMI
jgi:hypothetical protein